MAGTSKFAQRAARAARRVNAGFIGAALALATLTAPATLLAADTLALILNGAQEVPPVNTAASASGTIVVGMDQSVSGNVNTTGVTATAVLIQQAAPGAKGPTVFSLTRTGNDSWAVPDGSRLNDEQYRSYKAGNLYINVQSDAHRDGEVRAQLR